MLLIQNNSYKADIGFKYRVYFYRNIFNLQYNRTKNLWDRMLYLYFKKVSVCLDFNDIHVFTNQLTSTITNINTLIDTIELILYKYQDTSLQNVQEFSNIFTITRDNSNNTFINGEKIIDGNVRMTLYKLSASAIKTLLTNSLFFTNITNDIPDNMNDNSCQSCVNTTDITNCVTGFSTKINLLETNLTAVNNRVTSLTNGLLANNEDDIVEMNRINTLQMTKANISTTINGYRLESNIVLDKNDIGLNNVDNTSDLNKSVSILTQSALDLKVDKRTTVNNKSLSSDIVLTFLDIGLNNIDNTSDLAKPVSLAQQTALNQKADKTITINGHDLSSNVTISSTDIGLDNVDNTSDINKPISTQTQAALDLKVNKLISINNKQLNSNIVLDKNDIGLNNLDNTSDLDKPVSTQQQIVFDYKVDKTTTINGHGLNNSVVLNKTDIGLDQVNNTSDTDKPVSLLMQTALNQKADKTLTINGHDLNTNVNLNKLDIGLDQVDNTSDLNKPTSTATQVLLNLKVDTSRTINGHDLNTNLTLNKTDIGLDQVDNTSDVNKPISTAQQNAFDLKVDKTTTINGHDLNTNVILNKTDIGLNQVDNTSDLNKPVSTQTQLKLDSITNSMIITSSILDSKANSFVTINNYSLTDNIILNKTDIGLDQVDNTSDLNKPVSFPVVQLLDTKEDLVNKNSADGYAGLDNNGKIPLYLMPPIIGSSLLYLGTWNAQTNTPQILNGVGTNGNYYKVSVAGTTSIDGTNTWNIGDWIIYNGSIWERVINNDLVSSVNSKVGNVILTKTDLGLSNVDNTSDLNKPISNAVNNVLSNKIDKLISFNVNNLPIINSSGMLIDSSYKIDDESVTQYNIWSSRQTMLSITDKTELNIPTFNFNNFSYPSLRNYFSTSQSDSRLFSFNNNLSLNNNAYAGSVYSPYEDRIYFVPFNQTTQLHYIDCKTESIQSTPISNLVTNAYIGGAYSPTENRIYFAPYNQNNTLHYIDCNSGTVVEYQYNTQGAVSYGAVYSPKQNRIYFVPHSSHSQCMYIDCNVGSISTFLHGLQIVNNAYAGGVYSPTEDKIYFVPYAQNTKFCYINCSNTSVVEYVSNVTINQNAYIGGVYSPTNNYIYLIPHQQTLNIHYIDCNNDGIVGSIQYTGTSKYAGGVYINKQIYMIPYENGQLQYINTDNNQLYNLGSVTGSFFGGSYSPTQNKLYPTPHTTNNLIYVHLLDNNNISKSLMAGALFNKL
jgi:hypothetical protein